MVKRTKRSYLKILSLTLIPTIGVILFVKYIGTSADKILLEIVSNPLVHVVSIEKKISSLDVLLPNYFEISHKSFSLRVPWKEIKKRAELEDGVISVKFNNGKSILLGIKFPNLKETLQAHALALLEKNYPRNSKEANIQILKNDFGQTFFESNYAAYKSILDAIPPKYSAFSFLNSFSLEFGTKKRKNTILITLLAQKIIWMSIFFPDGKQGPFYFFNTPLVRGFIGGSTGETRVLFFNKKDEGYEFSVHNATDPEIEYIISSITPPT